MQTLGTCEDCSRSSHPVRRAAPQSWTLVTAEPRETPCQWAPQQHVFEMWFDSPRRLNKRWLSVLFWLTDASARQGRAQRPFLNLPELTVRNAFISRLSFISLNILTPVYSAPCAHWLRNPNWSCRGLHGAAPRLTLVGATKLCTSLSPPEETRQNAHLSSLPSFR